MFRLNLLILLSAFCLMSSFTVRTQSIPYYYPSETEKTTSTYGGTEKTTSTYGGTEPTSTYGGTEKTTSTYGGTEKTTSTYGGTETTTSTYGGTEKTTSTYGGSGYSAPYNYDTDMSEQMTSDYDEENYNYDSGNYGGSDTESNYGQKTSYGSGSSSYSGQYDSSSTTTTPTFPTSLLTGFVVDIHFLAVDPRYQYIAYHYCSDLFPGYTQCAIYNGTASNSRMIATEIVVSEAIFKTLPMEERVLYHSHAFSVLNGLLVLPGVPAAQEEQVYKGVMSTYGKVVDYWHSFQDFPLGCPRLAYGLATLSQINETIADELDASLKLSTTWKQRQASRASWTAPTLVAGANDYLTSGHFPQYVIKEFAVNPSDQ